MDCHQEVLLSDIFCNGVWWFACARLLVWTVYEYLWNSMNIFLLFEHFFHWTVPRFPLRTMWRRNGFRAETFDITVDAGHDVLSEQGFLSLVALILRHTVHIWYLWICWRIFWNLLEQFHVLGICSGLFGIFLFFNVFHFFCAAGSCHKQWCCLGHHAHFLCTSAILYTWELCWIHGATANMLVYGWQMPLWRILWPDSKWKHYKIIMLVHPHTVYTCLYCTILETFEIEILDSRFMAMVRGC